jgi:hypothetical protein
MGSLDQAGLGLHGTDGPDGERGSLPDRGGSAGTAELGKAFGLGSVAVEAGVAHAVDQERLAFVPTKVPWLSLVPAHQNAPAAPPAAPNPLDDAKPSQGAGGGGGGGGGGSDDHGNGHDGKEPPGNDRDPSKPAPGSKDDPPKRSNHAPVSAGSVDLGSGLVNESIIISLSQLLTGTTDPDSDILMVQSLQADSGSLQMLEPDRWLYTPEHDQSGIVAFSYRITDGDASIAQTARAEFSLQPDEEIRGTDGDDVLVGTPRTDIIHAGAGNDIAYGRESNDVISGGDGNDRIVGGDGDDVLFGGPGNDTISGGPGNDTLFGEAGNDVLFGDGGDDLIMGGEGDDFASGGSGEDTILGGPGADVLHGDQGDDRVDGGGGDDNIDGGSGSDELVGGAGNDVINAGEGNDKIDGGSGNDTLCGEDGDDELEGGEGNDHLYGGSGDDTLSGGEGNDVADGGAGNDVILLTEGQGHDVITGGEGADTLDLSTLVFDDTVDLPDGIVVIYGGKSAQIFEIENVHGGHGRDRLVADTHVNIMTGGDGNDTFVFRNLSSLTNEDGPRDHITDFSVGDKLDLSRVGQELDDIAGKKLFFAAADSAKFDEVGAVTYQHEIVSDKEITVVSGNLDDDSEPEFEIVLEGHVELTEADFIFGPAAQANNSQHGS